MSVTRTDPPVVTAGPDKITAAIDHDRTDRTTLERAEATIRRGLLDAARGLGDIRDGRLYKAAGFTSFDAYCRARLGFSRDRADQIISAGAVIAGLPTNVGSRLNEAHARALAPIAQDPAYCAQIVTEVEEEHGKVTANAITAKIEDHQAKSALLDDIGSLLVSIQQHANSIWTTCLEARAAGDDEVWAAGQDQLVMVGKMMSEVIDGDIDTIRKLIAEAGR